MKKLHTFGLDDRLQAAILKEILGKEGIDCLLRNEHLFAAMGEIPMTECFPELWVVDEDAFPRAKLLLDGWLKDDIGTSVPWQCPKCGERLEGQFGACWSCGRARE